jgi:LPS-assembly protein
MLLAMPGTGLAQTAEAGLAPVAADPGEVVDFSADQVTYEGDGEIVAATGSVRMSRKGNYLAADQVVWNRSSGEVRAIGNVVLITPEGDKLVGDNVVLTDTLRDWKAEAGSRRHKARAPARSPRLRTPSTRRAP